MITTAVTQKMNMPSKSSRNKLNYFNNQQWKPPVAQKSSNNSKQDWRSNSRQSVCCQLCQKLGHTADVYCFESNNHFEGLGFWILAGLIMSPLIRTIIKSIQAIRAYPWVTVKPFLVLILVQSLIQASNSAFRL